MESPTATAHFALLILGQILAIVGTIGIALNGIPQPIYDTSGKSYMEATQIDVKAQQEGIAGLERHTRISRGYLWTLAVGMALQLVATVAELNVPAS